jgi:E3 ubiquitin-protein ligase TRIP12
MPPRVTRSSARLSSGSSNAQDSPHIHTPPNPSTTVTSSTKKRKASAHEPSPEAEQEGTIDPPRRRPKRSKNESLDLPALPSTLPPTLPPALTPKSRFSRKGRAATVMSNAGYAPLLFWFLMLHETPTDCYRPSTGPSEEPSNSPPLAPTTTALSKRKSRNSKKDAQRRF